VTKKLLWAFLIIPLIVSLLNLNLACVAAIEPEDIAGISVTPFIAVIPQHTVDYTLVPGESHTISIYTDYNGTDIWGWELTLTYNPLILEGISVTNGDLITSEKDPSATFLPGTFDNNAGKLTLTGAVFMPPLPPSPPVPLTEGPGTLANVTFNVVGSGISDITLGQETRLIGVTEDGHGEKTNIIDHFTPSLNNLVHGYFENTEEEVTHDITVISVEPSPTSVEAGALVNITVTVENNGTETETFDVKVFYDHEHPNWLIGTETISNLEADAMKTLTISWETTIDNVGTFNIIAVVESVIGETDLEDNTLESTETITVTRPPEEPLTNYIIIGVVVVVVVLGAYLVIRIMRGRGKGSA
jgi:hypothetical protein